jgi:hypothetical protein
MNPSQAPTATRRGEVDKTRDVTPLISSFPNIPSILPPQFLPHFLSSFQLFQNSSLTNLYPNNIMASNPPAACCTVGVKHEGEAKGQFQQVGGGMLDYADLRLNIPLNFRIANSSLTDCPPS